MTSFFSFAKSLLLALILLSTSKASFAGGPLLLKYDPSVRDSTPKAISQPCNINFIAFLDLRNNQDNIGNELNTLRVDGVMSWFEQGLLGLRAYGYATTREGMVKPNALNIDARLTRSYTFLGGSRINGVIAFELLVTSPKGNQSTIKIRAFGSKTNMMGSDSEFLTALNYAINNSLVKSSRRLENICSN